MRITSLNLNGIRSAASKGLADWVSSSRLDFLCVQELKAQAADLSDELSVLAGLPGHFHHAEKKGYSGVGIYTRHEPSEVIVGMGHPAFDAEGRYLELRFDTPQRRLSLLSVYFPSGSSGEDRQDMKFQFLEAIRPLLRAHSASREFILCGDVNIAHQEQDLKNWKGNRKNSGFLPEERAWMTQLLQEDGLVDVYRRLHPNTTDECYTWWSARGQAYAKNVGWRIDYQLATPGLAETASAVSIFKDQRFSDHAPLTVDYRFEL